MRRSKLSSRSVGEKMVMPTLASPSSPTNTSSFSRITPPSGPGVISISEPATIRLRPSSNSRPSWYSFL